MLTYTVHFKYFKLPLHKLIYPPRVISCLSYTSWHINLHKRQHLSTVFLIVQLFSIRQTVLTGFLLCLYVLLIESSLSVFKKWDAFIGYRDDTPAAVVFQANHQLQRLSQNQDLQSSEWTRFKGIGIFTEELTPARLLSEREDPGIWTEAVRIQFFERYASY